MKISIIIPIYNVEQFISKCLESVMQQTFTDFEVILVNDGSTDKSIEIAKQFAENDARFRIITQDNKGLSGARNTGVKEAKGNYVFYLDSDDYLVPKALELLVKAAEKYQADAIQGNFYYDYPDHLLLNKQQKEKEVVYTRDEAMMALLQHKTVLNFAWGKLIKTKLAKQFLFPEGKFYEDTLWMAQLLHHCNQYVALNIPILYYLQRPSGISGGFSIRNLDQLEGEVDRIHFLQQNYPAGYVHQALQLLNQKVIQHTSLLHFLNEQEQIVYIRKLNEIENEFGLKQLFYLEYNKINQTVKKIKIGVINRIWNKSGWKKIIKLKNGIN